MNHAVVPRTHIVMRRHSSVIRMAPRDVGRRRGDFVRRNYRNVARASRDVHDVRDGSKLVRDVRNVALRRRATLRTSPPPSWSSSRDVAHVAVVASSSSDTVTWTYADTISL